jgi:hypothetical protein
MNKPDPKSYFDMSDKEKAEIIDKAAKSSMDEQRELIAKAKQKECNHELCGCAADEWGIEHRTCAHSTCEPDTSLNTWEERFENKIFSILKVGEGGTSQVLANEIVGLFTEEVEQAVSLAVQKEREGFARDVEMLVGVQDNKKHNMALLRLKNKIISNKKEEVNHER